MKTLNTYIEERLVLSKNKNTLEFTFSEPPCPDEFYQDTYCSTFYEFQINGDFCGFIQVQNNEFCHVITNKELFDKYNDTSKHKVLSVLDFDSDIYEAIKKEFNIKAECYIKTYQEFAEDVDEFIVVCVTREEDINDWISFVEYFNECMRDMGESAKIERTTPEDYDEIFK
jgi:hypothetical protein